MKTTDLLDRLHRAGATVQIVDGTPRIRGAKISAELMQALKVNRAELLVELEGRQAEHRDRFGQVPPADAPLLADGMKLLWAARQQILACTFRQPRPVHAWVMRRSAKYFEQGVPADDCEWQACVDVIAWQRACSRAEAVAFVVVAVSA